ncbi:YwmB family TATA-box binding protein [Thermoanaerobacterium sp. RBIITD]|uniref:YwmB family TATA-box binding protein n=1 Tax=Thermoanaerobacterium sp. RBIITD TaxID=1550240 RepID=UPI000BB88433|nr:YwmB family TATA-box binding protein [Thermoanaerobacterium sp. RBIITD]SNX53554.1 TATA-box binding [Thermoanaerobacterium sp. RBIITD]
MFKKLSLVIITIIVVFALLNSQMNAFSAKNDDILLLQNSFTETGAHYEYSNINAWAKSSTKFTMMNEMANTSAKIIKSMGIDDKKVKVSKLNQENFRQYDSEYDAGNKKVSIIIQSIKNDASSETYILIDEYLLHNNMNVADELSKINKAYSSLSLEPKIATCYVGTFPGQLNKDRISSIVKEVMGNMDAAKVEGLNDENLFSISAHTNKIKEYIELGSEKINLNISLRYSKYDNKTYIWVATPIIAIEY